MASKPDRQQPLDGSTPQPPEPVGPHWIQLKKALLDPGSWTEIDLAGMQDDHLYYRTPVTSTPSGRSRRFPKGRPALDAALLMVRVFDSGRLSALLAESDDPRLMLSERWRVLMVVPSQDVPIQGPLVFRLDGTYATAATISDGDVDAPVFLVDRPSPPPGSLGPRPVAERGSR